jgi:hypothetical protein
LIDLTEQVTDFVAQKAKSNSTNFLTMPYIWPLYAGGFSEIVTLLELLDFVRFRNTTYPLDLLDILDRE